MQKARSEQQTVPTDIDPDFYDRPSTPDELAARQRLREMMFRQGWKQVYPSIHPYGEKQAKRKSHIL